MTPHLTPNPLTEKELEEMEKLFLWNLGTEVHENQCKYHYEGEVKGCDCVYGITRRIFLELKRLRAGPSEEDKERIIILLKNLEEDNYCDGTDAIWLSSQVKKYMVIE